MTAPIDEFVTTFEDPRLVDLAADGLDDKARYLYRGAFGAAKTLLEEMDKKGIDYGEQGEFYITVGYRRAA
jgi:hypothetical protein